jgi:ligand-binding sensor domain-containing protein/signal transduction histidine kinase
MFKTIGLTISTVICFVMTISAIPSITVAATAEEGLAFEDITTKDGLSHNFIWAIEQDHYGYMWFGTANGLNKYDGINFDIYKYDSSVDKTISSSDIRCIYETSGGQLWIGTQNGLNLFNRETETFTSYLNNPDDPLSISNSCIAIIYEDSAHNLWIGTNYGLNLFNCENGTFSSYLNNQDNPDSISGNFITAIYEDSAHHLWVGTSKGLNLFDYTDGTFITYFSNPDNPGYLSDSYITAIYEDSDGTIWIGTGNGLNRYNGDINTFITYTSDSQDQYNLSDNFITALCEDNNGYLWVGTGNGLNRMDKKAGTFLSCFSDINNPSSLNNNHITSVFNDHENIMWIGTSFGINILNFNKQVFKYYTGSLYKSTISGICSNDGVNLWIATNDGIVELNSENKTIENIYTDILWRQGIYSHISNVLCIGKDGSLWFTGDNLGLARYNPVTDITTYYKYDPDNDASIPNGTIVSLYADHNGIIWIGTESGLCSYNPDIDKIKRFTGNSNYAQELSKGYITVTYETSDYNLWFGTYNGLYMLNTSTDKITLIAGEGSAIDLSGNTVFSICESSDNKLWIASTAGLHCYDLNIGDFVSYGISTDMLKDWVFGITEDNEGDIWVTFRQGLGKISVKDNTYTSYYVKDGLKNDSFCVGACYKTENGELFFGTLNGLVSFHPEDIKENTESPRIVINEFSLINGEMTFEEPVEDIRELKLAYAQNSFSIDFVALSYNSPRDNIYAYKLEGFENNWNYCNAEESFTKYTNLNAGEYTFIVKGANSAGVWNEEGVSLKIIVEPPFWQEWWFILSLLVLVIFFIIMAIKVRTHVLSSYAQKLEFKFEERTAKLVKTTKDLKRQMRQKSYSTDALMHDIKTPLTSLVSASELLINNQGPNQSELRKQVYKSTLILQKKVNDYFELIKNERGLLNLNKGMVSLENLIMDVLECTQSKLDEKSIEVALDINHDLPEVAADSQKITQVIFNLLDNAIKFTPAHGKILIKTDKVADELLFTIKNDGSFISKADIANIFIPYYHRKKDNGRIDSVGLGLSICKIYIELHGGRIWAESKHNSETYFFFTLPVSGEMIETNGEENK